MVVASPHGDPVIGGVVRFAFAPANNGAGASLSAPTVTIGANGHAAITATANGGGYTVTASASGVASPTLFALTNVQASIGGGVVAWGKDTSGLLTAGDGLRLLPAGRNTDLIWLGIDQIATTLNAPATLTAANVTVTGITLANYGPVTLSRSGTTYTISLARPINAADRVTLTIGSAGIATYTRRLDVLPGDVNDDGYVTSADVGTALANLGFVSHFVDVEDDGLVTMADVKKIRGLNGTSLPPAT